MKYLLYILYRLKLWSKITIIGTKSGGKLEIYHHFYTHSGMANVGDYIVIGDNKEDIVFIVTNKSFNYKKNKHTCWILVEPIK